MRVKYNYGDFSKIEASAIKDLEKLIGESPTVVIVDKSVTGLDIRRYLLKKLPELIGSIANSQILDINKNYISAFPDSILKMEHIENQIEKSKNYGNEIKLVLLDSIQFQIR